MKPSVPFLLGLLGLLGLVDSAWARVEPGRDTLAAALIGGQAIRVFGYQPQGCRRRGVLLVFHGRKRNAADYRDHAKRLADRRCLRVFAPEFDKARFSNRRYQRGGIVRRGRVEPSSRWASTLVRELVAWARDRVDEPGVPVWLFGHSAGGQFLSRAAAYGDLGRVTRIVIANPSTHVWADTEEHAPYGLGGVYTGSEARHALARYLRQPVSIYLGSRDTGRRNLHDSAQARRQGEDRLQRGRNVFSHAQTRSRRLDMPFRWRLVQAKGVAHSARGMLQAPEVVRAFGFPIADPVRAVGPGLPLQPKVTRMAR